MSTKRQQTMAKIARERSVKEKRARKQEKKLERKLEKELAAAGGGVPTVEEAPLEGVVEEAPLEEAPLARAVD